MGYGNEDPDDDGDSIRDARLEGQLTGCVQTGCGCMGHKMPGVHHLVPCCDVPHVEATDGGQKHWVECPRCETVIPATVLLGQSIMRAKDNALRSHNVREHRELWEGKFEE